jgi:hypothetical protein
VRNISLAFRLLSGAVNDVIHGTKVGNNVARFIRQLFCKAIVKYMKVELIFHFIPSST